MPEQKTREIFALDFSAPWKKVLYEKVLPLYPNFRSGAALGRQVLQEFILCHLNEEEAREDDLLASYQSLGKPEVLLFAIGKSEEIRRKESSEGPVQAVRRRTGGGRG